MTSTRITPYLRAKAEGILDAAATDRRKHYFLSPPGRGDVWPGANGYEVISDSNDLEALLGLPRENALAIVAHRLRNWHQKPPPKCLASITGEPLAHNADSDPWPHALFVGPKNACRVKVMGTRGNPVECGETLDWQFKPGTNDLCGFCHSRHPIDVAKYHYDTGVGGYFANRNRAYAATLTTPNNGDSQ